MAKLRFVEQNDVCTRCIGIRYGLILYTTKSPLRSADTSAFKAKLSHIALLRNQWEDRVERTPQDHLLGHTKDSVERRTPRQTSAESLARLLQAPTDNHQLKCTDLNCRGDRLRRDPAIEDTSGDAPAILSCAVFSKQSTHRCTRSAFCSKSRRLSFILS